MRTNFFLVIALCKNNSEDKQVPFKFLCFICCMCVTSITKGTSNYCHTTFVLYVVSVNHPSVYPRIRYTCNIAEWMIVSVLRWSTVYITGQECQSIPGIPGYSDIGLASVLRVCLSWDYSWSAPRHV
jgi:hypothetical protein